MSTIVERSVGIKHREGVAQFTVSSVIPGIKTITLNIADCKCRFVPSKLLAIRKDHLDYLKMVVAVNMKALELSDDCMRVSLDVKTGAKGWVEQVTGLLNSKFTEPL